jgi:hypothetical protein
VMCPSSEPSAVVGAEPATSSGHRPRHRDRQSARCLRI